MKMFSGTVVQSVDPSDPALSLRARQYYVRHIALVLCRVQQRLESRLLVNTDLKGLMVGEASGSPRNDRVARIAARQAVDDSSAYATAREAEVLAVTEELRLLDAIPEVEATTLAGVVAKLEMIVGADREIDSQGDFPRPHIASVLRDLKAIAGDLQVHRPDRAAVRADIARHWKAAARLVAALEEEDARERCDQAG